MTDANLLEVRDLAVTFGAGRNAVAAVKGVSFDLRPGRTLGDAEPFVDDRIPIADAYLDRAYMGHAGLLTAIGPDGTPVTDGPAADPLIAEARRFYDTVAAPATFDGWKSAFGFPARTSQQSAPGCQCSSSSVSPSSRGRSCASQCQDSCSKTSAPCRPASRRRTRVAPSTSKR